MRCHGCAARRCASEIAVAGMTLAKARPKNERPVRGDNRTGQAIWALGMDGRSRRIQPRWGGITTPTCMGRGKPAARSNVSRIFLAFGRKFWTENYCAAARLASPGADFSGATADGWSKAPVAGPSCRFESFSAAAGSNAAATGARWGGSRDRRIGIRFTSAEKIVAAWSAEIASSPHQDRAHIVRLQRRIALEHQGDETAYISGGNHHNAPGGGGGDAAFDQRIVRTGEAHIDDLRAVRRSVVEPL